MTAHGDTATGGFTPGFDPDNPTRALYDSYQLLLTDTDGRTSRRPVRYHVEVTPDLPPDVEIVSPKEEDAGVAKDGSLDVRVRAEDPDFALRRVILQLEREGRSQPLTLLERPRPARPWQGPFEARYTLRPAKLGLHSGDRLRYWAEAWTTRSPRPTARRPARG